MKITDDKSNEIKLKLCTKYTEYTKYSMLCFERDADYILELLGHQGKAIVCMVNSYCEEKYKYPLSFNNEKCRNILLSKTIDYEKSLFITVGDYHFETLRFIKKEESKCL